jgi:PAS domain-containing protein
MRRMPGKRAAPVRAFHAAHRPTFVVGVGGSAASFDAFEQFFASAPPDTGMAFMVITHRDPDHRGLVPDSLQRVTTMPVRQVEDRMRLAANAVYMIAPGRTLEIDGDVLHLRPPSRSGPRAPIDALFRSLAHEHGQTSIGVVLSGAGSDGAKGLVGITEAGGAALVQAPSTAVFDAMPRAALAAVPDAWIGAPDELAVRIAGHGTGPRAASAPARERWPGLVWVRDLVLGQDVYLNEQARRQLRAEPIGARFESLLHPDDAAACGARLTRWQSLRRDEVVSRPVRLRAPDGMYAPFQLRESVLAWSTTGSPIRVLAVLEPSGAR